MATLYSTSAALLFTEQELGGPCLEQESIVTVTTQIAQAINGNGDRVGLLMINLGTNQINIGLTSALSSTQGILLPAAGGFFSMTVRDDFTLPSRAWFALAQIGSSTLYVLEVIRFTSNQVGGD